MVTGEHHLAFRELVIEITCGTSGSVQATAATVPVIIPGMTPIASLRSQ
jgi:hypothetical protein